MDQVVEIKYPEQFDNTSRRRPVRAYIAALDILAQGDSLAASG